MATYAWTFSAGFALFLFFCCRRRPRRLPLMLLLLLMYYRCSLLDTVHRAPAAVL